MTLERPTIVIFDMDGTTVRHINLMLLHILEKLDDFGYLLRLSVIRQAQILDQTACGWAIE